MKIALIYNLYTLKYTKVFITNKLLKIKIRKMMTLIKCKRSGYHFHKNERLIPYLQESITLIKSFNTEKNTLEEAIAYLKSSQVEFKTQHHIIDKILAKKSYSIKTMYKNLIEANLIEDNILFSEKNRFQFQKIYQIIFLISVRIARIIMEA